MFSLLSRICLLSKRTVHLVRPSQLITFTFFLVLSGIFWLSTALNEEYDREVVIPIEIDGLPKDVVLSGATDDSIHVVIRDKGYALMKFLNGKGKHNLIVNFPAYSRSDGKAVVSAAELMKLVKQQFSSSSTIVSLKPDRLEYTFVKGSPKVVPVRLSGDIVPADNYYLAHTLITPQNVTIYAGRHLLDSIKFVRTEDLHLENFTDTVEYEVSLKAIPGVRISPQKVKVKLYTDVLTEETIEVPIVTLNVPEGIHLRTFPARVKIKYNVGASLYRTINTGQFIVVADYNDLKEGSDRCPIKITSMPMSITKLQLEFEAVDYLIEN